MGFANPPLPAAPGGGQYIRSATLVVAASDSKDTVDVDYACDGTDDQVEINQAIAALPAGGGLIHLLEGTYNVSGAITIDRDNVTIIGTGANTIIRIIDNHNANINVIEATNFDNILIKDLHIDGNRANQVAGVMNGVDFNTVTHSKIAHCWANNLMNSGILLDNNSTYNTVTGNTCRGNQDGIRLWTGCNNNTLTENTCYDGITFGIGLTTAHHNTITGNICNNNGTVHQHDGIILFAACEDNAITGNTCSGNGDDGISLNGASYSNTVAGNTCSGNNGPGILLDTCGNNTITGNICSENDDSGIWLHDSSINTVVGNTVTTNTVGINITGASNNNIIEGNTITGNTLNGIFLTGDYHTVNGNLCADNAFDGIRVNNCDHCTIVGNEIRNNGLGADNTYDGIEVRGGCDYNIIQGNTIRTTTAAPPPNRQRYGIRVAAGATGNIVANNNLYQSGQTANYGDAGTDTRGTYTGESSPTGNTLVVAASNSLDPVRADYYCDGTADQTEINAAITALGAIGGTVKLLEGTYNITASINLASEVSLIGQGSGTLLFIPNGTDGTFSVIVGNGVDHLLVKDLRIDGNRANQAAGNTQGIYFTGAACDHSRITGCWIENMFGTATTEGCGIRLYDGGDATIIDDNDLMGNYGIGIYVEGRVQGCDRVTISNNLCLNNDEDGIRVDESDDVIVTGNVCYANSEDGISLGALPLTALHGCLVSSNTVTRNGYHGIHLVNCLHSTIEGNSVIENSEDTDVTYDGIYLESGCDYNNIQGNTIRTTVAANRHRYGINIANANCDENIVKDNDLYQAGQTGLFNDAGTRTKLPELWVNSIFDDSDIHATLSNIGDHVSLELAAGLWDTYVRFNFRVPSDFHQLVRARIVVVSEATGDVSWGVATDWGLCGELYNAGSDAIGITLTPVTINEIECLDMNAALDGITAGDHVGVQFEHQSGASVAAALHLLQFWLQYV